MQWSLQRFAWLGLLVAVVAGGAWLYLREPKQPDAIELAAAMPEVAKLSGMASVMHPTSAHAVGQDAATIDFADGAKVIIPQGALPSKTTLRVTAVDLGLEKIAFDVKQAWAFALETETDFPELTEPVILEVPVPTQGHSVAQWTNGQWKVIKVEPGPITRIPVRHFSRSIFSIFEWFSSTQAQVERGLTMNNPRDPINFANSKIEKGGAGVKAFYGVDEYDGKEGCQGIVDMLAALDDPQAFKFRDLSMQLPSPQAIGQFLHAAQTPSSFGGYYHDVVKDSHAVIHSQVTALPGRASPAEFLKICIKANGGNVPLGVLAAHNYLKDITYRGRDSWDSGRGMPEDCGAAATHLGSWREQGNKADGGYYDKMGPLYHVFAGMTATVWGGKILGIAAIEGEAMLRTVRSGSDMPDKSKGRADECGMHIGRWILDREPKDQPPPAQPAKIDYASVARKAANLLMLPEGKIDDRGTGGCYWMDKPGNYDHSMTIQTFPNDDFAKQHFDKVNATYGKDQLNAVAIPGAENAFVIRSTNEQYNDIPRMVRARVGKILLYTEISTNPMNRVDALRTMTVLVEQLRAAQQ